MSGVWGCWSLLPARFLNRKVWPTWRWCWRSGFCCEVRGLLISKLVVGCWRPVVLGWFGTWCPCLCPHHYWRHCPGKQTCRLPWCFLDIVALGVVFSLPSWPPPFRCWFGGQSFLLLLQHDIAVLAHLDVCETEGWCRLPSPGLPATSWRSTVFQFSYLPWPAAIQSTTNRKFVGDNKQPWGTPVCTEKGSVNFQSWMTWQVASSYSRWMMVTNDGRMNQQRRNSGRRLSGHWSHAGQQQFFFSQAKPFTTASRLSNCIIHGTRATFTVNLEQGSCS